MVEYGGSGVVFRHSTFFFSYFSSIFFVEIYTTIYKLLLSDSHTKLLELKSWNMATELREKFLKYLRERENLRFSILRLKIYLSKVTSDS